MIQPARLFSQAPPGVNYTRPSVAPPLDQLTPSPPPEEHHFKWGLAGALALTAGTALLAGCTQQPAPVVQVQTQTHEDVKPEPIVNQDPGVLNFELSPTQQVRVDVIRQTHTETRTDSDGKEHEETVNDDYQPFSVYLGDGLMLDSDMNLSVAPDRIFNGPIIPQNFSHMDVTGALGSWTKVSLDKSGNTVTVHQPLTPDMTVVREGDSTTIHPFAKGPKSWQKFVDVTITRSGNETRIHPWSHFDDITITRQANGNLVVHQWGPKAFDTVISRQGDQVTVQPWGGGFSRTTITRKADHIEAHSLGWTETISHQGNQVVSKPPLGFKSTITNEGNGSYTLKEGWDFPTHVTVR